MTVSTKIFFPRMILASLFALALGFLWHQPAYAATIQVDDTGCSISGPTYCTMQQAMAVANDGDVINVNPGFYSGVVTVNKSVTIQTSGSGTWLLTGAFHLQVDEITIDGFAVTGANVPAWGGGSVAINIDADTSGHVIQNNGLAGPGAGANRIGIQVGYDVTDLTIENNTIKDWNTGIYLNPSSGHTIQNNLIQDNVAGIGSDGISNVTISENTFSGNDEGFGASAVGANIQVHYNDFLSNDAAIMHYGGANRIEARANWYGNANGPDGNGPGTGDDVSNNVVFCPWLNNVQGTGVPTNEPTKGLAYSPEDTIPYCNIQDAVNISDPGQTVTTTAGIFTGTVVINKQLTLDGSGAGTNSALHTILDGTGYTGNGITLSPDIEGIVIQDVRVQDFNIGTGASGIRGTRNDTLLIQNVHVENNGAVGQAAGGIFLGGPIDGVTITNVRATNNWSRGIVIWDGLKQNISITNNYVAGNDCCGIELQDGTATGVTVTGNIVENNTDSGMAFIGLQGPGANLIANNHVSNNDRFGIEIKLPNGSGQDSGPGSIVVSGNFITQTTLSVAEERDLAGIAVYRRGWVNGSGNVDIPNGVVVKNNTVTGIAQTNGASDSDGFCIVVEGTNMQVLSNTVSSCDVGIQMQDGHTPYAANSSTDGNQNDLDDDYFGRGNSPVSSGVIYYNNVAGNAIGIRNVGVTGNIDARANWHGAANGPGTVYTGGGVPVSAGVTFCPWLDNVPGTGELTNAATFGLAYSPNDDLPFCKIQDALRVSSAGQTVTATAGIFNENVLITQTITLAGAAAGDDFAQHTIIDGNSPATLTGIGIEIANGVTGVTIRDLRVQDFTGVGGNGIRGNGTNNNNTTIEDVHVHNNGVIGIAGGGIYFNGPINGLSINNVRATNNLSRGIVVWNGFKQNITLTNNYVAGNNCCGIELQDGTASGVTATGNVIENNADSGMAFTGLTDGAGPNLIANNHVSNNGRFGIEIKLPDGTGATSGDGSILITNNFVTRTLAIGGEVRDIAGIAVMRRGWVTGNDNVDIPNGVVLQSNQVTGYQQPSTSDGFCIVVEGTNMQVLSNTVSSCDVGIQMQAGHTPYTANTSTDGNQNNVNDQYFGRGNSPISSGVIYYNNVAGNATGIRNVGVTGNVDARANWHGAANGPGTVHTGGGVPVSAGVTFCPWLDNVPGTGQLTRGSAGLVYTSSDPVPYCSIQAAINASANGDVVTATPGTYNESPNVNKSILLTSSGGRDVTEITLQTGPTYLGALTINAISVTVEGFTIIGADGVAPTNVANSNILIEDLPETVTIRNNRLKVAQIDTNTTGDDGFGIVSTYDEVEDVDLVIVTDNIFEPANASGNRAFYINPGVDVFRFFNNTITGNFTRRSFTQAKAGAIFENTITGVGAAGSRSGGIGTWGYPDPTVYGATVFTNNTISGVGAAITIIEAENVIVEGNTLSDNDKGVVVDTSVPLAFDVSTIAITSNNFDGNTQAIDNNVTSGDVDATNNWWGDATGPSTVAYGTGDPVSSDVIYCPWLNNVVGVGESTAPVTTTANANKYCTIQAAVNVSDNGDTVTAGPGVYNENVLITETITLEGAGAGVDFSQHTIIDGNSPAPLPGIGIEIANGVTGVTIRDLRVQDFTGAGSTGIRGNGTNNNNTTIEDVHVDNNGVAGPSGGGIYFNGPIDGLTINNVRATNNRTRGIVIWNGFKQNITLTNNYVANNDCCGIELQDGTATGVTATGNVVENNADSGMAFIGLQGPGANLIANNHIRNNDRFGIEIKLPNGSGQDSGPGSIVVSGNFITQTTLSVAEERDLAGIAVYRRGWVNGNSNVDIPNGVVVKNNTVTGIAQNNALSDSDGFCIVVEGTNMRVLSNTVTSCDVGIQMQDGHLPYAANTNTDGNQNDLDDDFFGRGNSPTSSGVIYYNNVAGNLIGIRNVGVTGNIDARANWYNDADGPTGAGPGDTGDSVTAGVTFCPWLDDEPGTGELTRGMAGLVTTTSDPLPFCTIQAAVDASTTGAVVEASDGVYTENVLVNKTLTLQSENGRDTTSIVGISGAGALGTVQVTNNTNGFVLDGFTIEGIDNNIPGIENAAVYFQGPHSFANIINNEINANGDLAFLTEYSAVISHFLLDNNIFGGQTFTGTPAGVGSGQQFTLPNVPRQLVVMGGGAGGGNTSNITFTNNLVEGITGGPNGLGQEQGNTLVTLDSSGAFVDGNTFAGTSTWFSFSLRMRGPNSVITNNTFSNATMGVNTGHFFIQNHPVSVATVIANNTYDDGAYFANGDGAFYNGINVAVASAPSGETVEVFNGVYTETVRLKSGVDVDGESESGVVIHGSLVVTGTVADVLAKDFSVNNGSPTSYLLDMRYAGALTDLIFEHVTFALVEDFLPVNGPGTYSNDAPIGNSYARPSFELIDGGDVDNAGLTFLNVTMDSGDFEIGTANELALLFYKSNSGATMRLDGTTLRGLNTGTANLGAQLNTSPGSGETAYIDIANSSTEGGGNFYISGFAGANITGNSFDGQGLALNGVKSAVVSGNTFQNIDNTLTANGTQHRGLTIEDAWGTTGVADLTIENNTFSNISAADGAIAFQRFTSPPSDLATLARLQDVLVSSNTFNTVNTPVYLNSTYFGAGAALPMELMTVTAEPEQFAIGTPAIDTFVLTDSINNYSYGLRSFPGYIHSAMMITHTVSGDEMLLFAYERLEFTDEGLLIVAPSGSGAPFNNIQPAIDAAQAGDLIIVYPDDYSEVATNRSVLGSGSYQFGLFINKADLTIQGVDANGDPITDASATTAAIKTNATNSFGYSGIFVEADGVTLAGLKIQENLPSNNKTIEIIGDDFSLINSHVDVAPDGSNVGGAIYFGDWQYDVPNAISHIEAYTLTGNIFDHGSQISLSSGAGNGTPVTGRLISDNTFLIEGRPGPAISFNGAGGVPWFVYPVGAATITNNEFSGGGQYIRARGSYDNVGLNWTNIWNSNEFDRAAITLVGDYASPFDVRAYSYVSGSYTFTNVRMLGGSIQPHISDIGQPDDTVYVAPGVYNENIVYDEAVNLKGSGSGPAELCGLGDADTQTIITAATGNLIQLTASGLSSSNKLLIEDIRLELQATTGSQHGIGVATNVNNVELNSIRVIGNAANTSIAQRGVVVGSGASINNWDILDSSFNCLFVGVWFAKETTTSAAAVANNILVNGNDFRLNGIKGMYVEKLSNATIENNEFIDNSQAIDKVSTGAAHSAGLDINLKFGAYSNISVIGNTFTGNGLGASQGAALMIKARDDGATYGSLPATLISVTVASNLVTGNERGIRFGEPAPAAANAGPTDVQVNHNIIVTNTQTVVTPGSTYGGVIDWTSSPSIAVNRNAIYDNTAWNIAEANGGTVNGTCNWYNTSTGPGGTVANTVNASPWLITSDLDGDCVLGSLTVNLDVVGSLAYASATWEFTSTLGGFDIAQAGGTELFPNLGAATYVVTQTVDPDYSVLVDCGNGVQASNVVTIPLAMAENVSCTFTNTLKPATLVISKTVINNHGGTATVASFNYFVDGSPVNSGEVYTYTPGTYIVTESDVPNYSSIISGDCAANGVITLMPGMNYACTITNDDLVQGTVNLAKIVVGGSDFAPAGGWQFYLNSTPITVPASGGGALLTDLTPGTYTISEVVDGDYTTSFNCGAGLTVGSSTQISVGLGEVVSCVFTNTVNAATLTVDKVVINNNGGTADADDFPLFVDGQPVSNGVAISVTPGVHIVSEDAGAYTGSFSGACASNGSVSLLPGENKTCTITNNDPGQGTFNLTKVVVGTSEFAPSGGWQFFLDDTPLNIVASGGSIQITDIPPGSYTISEVVDADYATSFSCTDGTGMLGNSTSVTFTLGSTVSCVFTNTVNMATLTVEKVVVNNSGGIATADDFPLYVDGTPISRSVAFSITPGLHVVTEDAGTYTGSFSGACAANGSVSLAPGESKSCTVTNNDPGQGTLNLSKVVVGGSGFAPAGGWQFYLGSMPLNIGVNGGSTSITDIPPGTYTISEVVDGDYTASFSCGGATASVGSSTTITFALGSTVNCVFTNTVNSATLTVNKVVVNDSGGNADADDFPLFVDGQPISNGVAISVTPGVHVVTENAGTYVGTFSGDCSTNGTVNIVPGESKTCTITNNDPSQGTLNLTKVVVGGSSFAPAGGWDFFLGSTPLNIAATGGSKSLTDIPVGTYTISEVVDADYDTTFSCNGATASSGYSTTISFGLVSTVNCVFTNTVKNATITVDKIVVNDSGGSAVASDFPLFVDGNAVTDGVAISVTPGVHVVTENAGTYIGTFSGDCSTNGSMTLLPGESKTCTITNNDPGQGTLNLTKVVVGSTASAPAEGWSFFLGSTPITLPVSGGSTSMTDIPVGSYTISEVVDGDYTASFSCGGTTASVGSTTTITFALGQTVSCVFTNTVNSATLTVNKVVVNDNGGTAVADDFPLFVDGQPISNGVAISVTPGVHVVTEDAGTYTGSFSGACSTNGSVSLVPGESKTCTITNNDPSQGTLNLTKVVVGSNAFAPSGGWQFSLAGVTVTIPAAGGNQLISNIEPGTYTFSEVADADYTTQINCGAGVVNGNSLELTFGLGQTLSCVVTNTVNAATLTINKVVVNNNGGTADADDFPLFVDGNSVTNGVAISVTPGTHIVTEDAGTYIGSFGGDCSTAGTVNLLPGESKTCTITNNDPGQGTLNLTKVVVGSSAFAPVDGWQFTLGDTAITISASGGSQSVTDIEPGTYTLSEEADADYTTIVNCGNGPSTGTSAEITFALGQVVNCTFTNTLLDASLTVTKVVINDNGGTAEVADFPLFVNGSSVTSGNANTFAPGTYVVSEENQTGYQATFSGDCSANGTVNLAPGENKTCTITNNDIADSENVAAITLVKTVGVLEGVCATDKSISVVSNASVFYCYTITNNGNVTLTEHTLFDSNLGTLIDAEEISLAPGQTITSVALGIDAEALIEDDTINTATWTAVATNEALIVTASDTATVTVGIEDYDITIEGTYVAPTGGGTPGGQMLYDITVTNTGETVIKDLLLSFEVPFGTTYSADGSAWSCPDGSPAGTLCTFTIPVLYPGDVVELSLPFDIIAEINIDQLVLVLNSQPGTAPGTTGEQIRVVGPNALPKLFMFVPVLSRADEQ